MDYKLDIINSELLHPLQNYFTDLPLDFYTQGEYRYRRFSSFFISKSNIIQMTHSLFRQSDKYNTILGNIERDYQELSKELIKEQSFKEILKKFSNHCLNKSNFKSLEIGVHQIRITCSINQNGNPTPEGIHQDGMNKIGILCINRHQIEGGKTSLFYPNKERLVFQAKLYPGQLLILDDQKVWHHTSLIKPTPLSTNGFRDVFIFTQPSM